ncbi:unnamed protein product [Brassica napus]|nr:unnamed protein product [Brassica napus]
MACSISSNAVRCYTETLRLTPRQQQQCGRVKPTPSSFVSFNSSNQTLGASPSPVPRRSIPVRAKVAASEGSITGSNRMLVFVPPHPLIKHWISVLRNDQTPSPIFRSAIAELGRLLMYEASREWLPTVVGEIMSPMGAASVEFIDPREPIAVVPILRAGLALAEHASTVLPANKIYHLGISRDEETLLPSVYLNKLPDEFPENSRVFLVDPMLATANLSIFEDDILLLIRPFFFLNDQIEFSKLKIMQNEEGVVTELYIPRKCSATNRLITSKDHASVQLNIGHLDADGIYTGQFTTLALCGFVRAQGDADSGVDRLWQKKKVETKQQ